MTRRKEFLKVVFCTRRYSQEIIEHLVLEDIQGVGFKLNLLAKHVNMAVERYKKLVEEIKKDGDMKIHLFGGKGRTACGVHGQCHVEKSLEKVTCKRCLKTA